MVIKHDYNAAIGMKKGKMTVVSLAVRMRNQMYLQGICACGNWKTFSYHNFIRGGQLSCGCNQNPKRVTYNYKHPLYKIWQSMRGRCYNTNDPAYFNYGGRGVRVCYEWDNDFQPFYDWCIANGWQRGLFVDKDIRGDGLLYSPDTCSIVTRKVNNQARRSVKVTLLKAKEIRSSDLSTQDLTQKYNISKNTVYDIKAGRTWKEGRVISINDFLKDKPLY